MAVNKNVIFVFRFFYCVFFVLKCCNHVCVCFVRQNVLRGRLFTQFRKKKTQYTPSDEYEAGNDGYEIFYDCFIHLNSIQS